MIDINDSPQWPLVLDARKREQLLNFKAARIQHTINMLQKYPALLKEPQRSQLPKTTHGNNNYTD